MAISFSKTRDTNDIDSDVFNQVYRSFLDSDEDRRFRVGFFSDHFSAVCGKHDRAPLSVSFNDHTVTVFNAGTIRFHGNGEYAVVQNAGNAVLLMGEIIKQNLSRSLNGFSLGIENTDAETISGACKGVLTGFMTGFESFKESLANTEGSLRHVIAKELAQKARTPSPEELASIQNLFALQPD